MSFSGRSCTAAWAARGGASLCYVGLLTVLTLPCAKRHARLRYTGIDFRESERVQAHAHLGYASAWRRFPAGWDCEWRDYSVGERRARRKLTWQQ